MTRSLKNLIRVAKDYWDAMLRAGRKQPKPTFVLVRCESAEIACAVASEVRRLEGVDWCEVGQYEEPTWRQK